MIQREVCFTCKSFSSALMLALCAALCISAAAAEDNLSVRITPERDAYSVGEPIRVTYSISNDGAPIVIETNDCTPLFGLAVFNDEGTQVWNSQDCPSCCCTCCECPIHDVRRTIPAGESEWLNDTTWQQVRTTGHTICGCENQQVISGVYYLVGEVLNTFSVPVAITIQ